MSFDSLSPGAELPEFRVSAPAPAEPRENKIHEDDVARQYGFKGGLVPGVTVYGWLTHPIVEALGAEWLEKGSFRTRFTKPIYFEEPAVIRARVAARTGDSVIVEAAAHNAAGDVCGTAQMSLSRAPRPQPPDAGAYATAAMPGERPQVSRALLEGLRVLGTPELQLTPESAAMYLTRFGETLPLYRQAEPPAHPGTYLDLANRALSGNVRVSPWIHVESKGATGAWRAWASTSRCAPGSRVSSRRRGISSSSWISFSSPRAPAPWPRSGTPRSISSAPPEALRHAGPRQLSCQFWGAFPGRRSLPVHLVP